MRIVLVAAVLAILTSVAAAQAPGQTMSFDQEAPPSAAEPRIVSVRYQKDVLLADAVWMSTLFVALELDNEELGGWSLAGYFLAAPIVHVAHGRNTAALQSLGLRVGLPLLGGMVGYRLGDQGACKSSADSDHQSIEDGCPDMGSVVGLVLGAMAGGATAMILDVKYLTTYEKRVAPPAWSASLKPTHGGMSVGVTGTF